MDMRDRVFAVLVENQYEDQELWYPVRRLQEAGAKVLLVGPKAGQTYVSKHGYPAKSDRAAEDVTADDFDGLVIPGGYAPDHMRRHKAMVKLVADAVASGKPVASICHGGWMLASADVLKGRRVTSFFAIQDDLRNAGAEWVDKPVVCDGNLITSRRPDDLPQFMQAVLEKSGAGTEHVAT